MERAKEVVIIILGCGLAYLVAWGLHGLGWIARWRGRR